MKLREANVDDAEAIKNLVFGVLDEYGLKPDPGSTDRDLDDLDKYYKDNNGYFGVVEEQGRIVATVGIFKIDKTTCELRKMYALASTRGKGLGKYLLEHALEKAKELGYKQIVLETAAPLKEAVSLYRQYGFIEYDPEHLSARCDQAFKLELGAAQP